MILKSLKKPKFFFENNDDALSHLSDISKNPIDYWWESKNVSEVKNLFKRKYAIINNDKQRIEKLILFIKQILKNEL